MPDTPPLDATARAALRAKAEAARDARLAAEKYVAEVPDEMFSPAEHDRLVQQEYATDEAFRDACNDDVILALLAAVERGEEDTARLDWMDDQPSCFWLASTKRWTLTFPSETGDTGPNDDLRGAIDAARSATPTEGDDR